MDAAQTGKSEKVETPKDESHSGPGALLHAFVYSSVESPINGASQIINEVAGTHISQFAAPIDDSLWSKAGSLVGNVADFMLISKGVSKGFDSAGLSQTMAFRPVLEGGISGGVLEGLQPVQGSDRNFAVAKLGQIATGAGTFATMNGTYSWLDRTGYIGRVGLRSLSQDIAANSLSGVAGGVANAELSSVTQGKGLASVEQIGSGALNYGAFGAIMGGALHFGGGGRPELTSKSTDSAQAPLPSTEDFVSKGLDASKPIRSPILSWLAEQNPSLRPDNYEQLQATAPRDVYNQPRYLDINDWSPAQRPAVIDALRGIAKTNLADDSNLDAFISKLKSSNWGTEGFADSGKLDDLMPQWRQARSDLQTAVDSEPSLKGRTLSSIASDQALLQSKPELADALQRSISSEQEYRRIVGNLGLEDALNEAAGERNLPSLTAHVRSQFDGSYFGNQLFSSQSGLEQGLNTDSAATLAHEFVHHEQGTSNLRTLMNIMRFRAGVDTAHSTSVKLAGALKTIRGAFDSAADPETATGVAKDLTTPNSDLTQVVKLGGKPLPAEIRAISENAQQGGSLTPAESGTLQRYLVEQFQKLEPQASAARRDYLLDPVEKQAYAVQVLAGIRAQMAGLPESSLTQSTASAARDPGIENFLGTPLLDKNGNVRSTRISDI